MRSWRKWQQATSWLSPELLTIPLDTVRQWMSDTADLAVYGFAIEEVYRLQEHVLDEAGERLLSLSSRLSGAPNDAYQALSTADAKFPEVSLSTGETVTASYGQYRAVLATSRKQADRRAVFLGHYGTFAENLNSYAALYHGVCERDWFHARARERIRRRSRRRSTATTFRERSSTRSIAVARNGTEPVRRYHRLRKRLARPRPLLSLRLLDPARRVGPQVPLRRRPRADRRIGRDARARTTRRA